MEDQTLQQHFADLVFIFQKDFNKQFLQVCDAFQIGLSFVSLLHHRINIFPGQTGPFVCFPPLDPIAAAGAVRQFQIVLVQYFPHGFQIQVQCGIGDVQLGLQFPLADIA